MVHSIISSNNYDRQISWQEISKHNNNKDCWVVIDGYVYNITSWIGLHLGGEALSIFAGEDASAMYHSSHLRNTTHILEKFIIGKVQDYNPIFELYEDDFISDLKKKVLEYYTKNNINYRETKRNYIQIILTALLLFVCWAGMYLLPPWGILAAIPMGLATCSLIGSFGHEYIHGNLATKLSRKPGYWIINNILWGLFIPFMLARPFQYEHIKHHNYPMHPQHDYDVYALKDFVRLSPLVDKKTQHSYQHIYAPLTYGAYLFLQILGSYTTSFFDDRELSKDKGALRDVIFSLFIAFGFHIALPIYLTDIWWVVLCGGIYFFTWQASIYISSGVPHMTDVEAISGKEKSWAYHVCKSTKNVKSGSFFFNWLTGGLNNHLSHHLLPSIPQEHLDNVTPIVKEICNKYNYPYYNYTSLKHYYSDHRKFLIALGK